MRGDLSVEHAAGPALAARGATAKTHAEREEHRIRI